MLDANSEKPIHSPDLDGAAYLLEQLNLHAGRQADRPRIRRALENAFKEFPHPTEESWWKWTVESGRSLGMKCRVIDCTFDQLFHIVHCGAQVILQTPDGEKLQAIHLVGRRIGITRDDDSQMPTWVTARQLKQNVFRNGPNGAIRCVVVESRLSQAPSTHGNLDEPTPLRRLFALLTPEVGDIYILVIFSLVTGLLALATPIAVETLVNTVAFGRLLQPVVVLSLLLLGFLIFSAALRAVQTYVVEIIQRRLFARVVADLSYRLPRAEMESFDSRSSRELVNRFFDVVTVQKAAAQLLLDGLSLVLGTLVGMAVLAFYHPWLLGFDFVLLTLIAFVIFVLGRGAVKTSIKESKAKYNIAGWLEALASCPTAFRHYGGTEFAVDRADRLTYEYLSARRTHFRVLMRQIIFALMLQALASTALLGLGGWLVISGQLTLGQLVAAELIVTIIVGSFAKLGKHMESYYDLLASVDKLGQLFDLPMEREEGLLHLAVGDRAAHVVVQGVSYKSDCESRVLDHLNLEIEPGEWVTLFGKGDQGESILLDLLFGLRQPDQGYLNINGVDPRDLRPDVLRKRVALIRHVEVFDGTLAENVHLERPEVSIDDVRDSLRTVGLLDEVLQLPEGIESHLVEGGYPLTLNQARRLMLARALVGQPGLLLIDGLLDSLPDDDLAELIAFFDQDERPWTVVSVSGRRRVADASTRTLTLSSNSNGEFPEVSRAE